MAHITPTGVSVTNVKGAYADACPVEFIQIMQKQR